MKFTLKGEMLDYRKDMLLPHPSVASIVQYEIKLYKNSKSTEKPTGGIYRNASKKVCKVVIYNAVPNIETHLFKHLLKKS